MPPTETQTGLRSATRLTPSQIDSLAMALPPGESTRTMRPLMRSSFSISARASRMVTEPTLAPPRRLAGEDSPSTMGPSMWTRAIVGRVALLEGASASIWKMAKGLAKSMPPAPVRTSSVSYSMSP